MSLREEMAQAVFGKDTRYDRADAALRCVVKWLKSKQETEGFFIEGQWAVAALAKDIEAMIGKDARAVEVCTQPCDRFLGDGIPHDCPVCGGLGVREFCRNCHKDHHSFGWQSCKPAQAKECADRPQPIGNCPKCGTPVYTDVGFCGVCEPWKR